MAGNIWAKTHVEIINDLPGGTTLTIHCKSKDNDLGIQHIRSSWGFSFQPSISGRTLFFCTFAWSDQFQRFDIYVQGRDQNFCTQWVTPLNLMYVEEEDAVNSNITS
ncbi:hypothetical protein EUGRSUZ_L00538 [Eucalyptus grandis]|uniref:S-protein homolog n=1 Tax=Eucalyptus grandis TaxID=71139 RepID=A0A058ZV72_EUCGR|nr:hypothetical protein EUGRSUZ_L00538 [Eucalyptus grandis]